MAVTIAVLNTNEDVIEMLRTLVESAGFNSVGNHVPHIKRGEVNFISFIKQHDPVVIVYDIGPPYQENWNFFKMIKSTDVVKGRRFIVTTSNARLLREIAGVEADLLEISEKPYDVQAILKAVVEAAAA